MKVESEFCKSNDSFVNGANDGEAYPKRWVAALVQMNCEKKVAAKLNKMGIANYVPIQKEEHQWSDRKKRIDRVVIPMVVFVRLAKDEEDEFRKLSFILKFIPILVQRSWRLQYLMNKSKNLKFLLHNADAKDSIIENLKVGDKVRLVRGPMRGLEGELSHIEENKPILAIRIDGLGYACVKISKSDVEEL